MRGDKELGCKWRKKKEEKAIRTEREGCGEMTRVERRKMRKRNE
jgi:hypothetical protein